jgi:hypothetical protein
MSSPRHFSASHGLEESMRKIGSLSLLALVSASILTTTGCYNRHGFVIVNQQNNRTALFVLENSTATPATPPQVLEFPGNATGAPSPANTVTFAATATATATAIATDDFGDVYIADSTDLREYAPNAFNSNSTNPTPIVTIPANSTTTVGSITALAVDFFGNIYAAEQNGNIVVFSETANGSVAPIRTLTAGGLTTLVSPTALTIDNNGNLYVLDSNQAIAGQDTIDVFAPNANGNVAPIRTLTGASIGLVSGIATDPENNLYTANNLNGGSISIYTPGATGNATARFTINGSSTTLGNLFGIAVDQFFNIYVVTDGTPNNNVIPPNPTILKFSSTANGNVAPVSSFTSTAWSSTSPLVLAVN